MAKETQKIDDFEYFKDYYKPLQSDWSEKDLVKHKNWYYSWIKYIDNFVDLSSGTGKIFEIGSGIGAVVSIYSKRGFECIGSDISEYILERAKKINSDIPFIFCDIEKGIELDDNFDCILGFEVLEHINHLDDAISNIHSKLKEGGYFIGSTPYPYPKNMLDPTHVNVKYPIEWNNLFEKHGFETLVTPMSFLPFFHRIHKKLNLVLPRFISYTGFVSTCLIIAKKTQDGNTYVKKNTT